MTDGEHVTCLAAECGCKQGQADQPHARGPECHPGVSELEALQERWQRVQDLRAVVDDDGKPAMTLEEIGRQFDPPLSRQRVSQLLAKPRHESAGGARRPAPEHHHTPDDGCAERALRESGY